MGRHEHDGDAVRRPRAGRAGGGGAGDPASGQLVVLDAESGLDRVESRVSRLNLPPNTLGEVPGAGAFVSTVDTHLETTATWIGESRISSGTTAGAWSPRPTTTRRPTPAPTTSSGSCRGSPVTPRWRTTIALGVLLVAVTGCNDDATSGRDPAWPKHADPIASDGLVWGTGSEVHLPDGTVIELDQPVGSYVVAGSGIWYLFADQDSEVDFKLATADGEVVDTDANPYAPSLRTSADGRWLAFLDRPAGDDGPREAVVIDLTTGEEVVRSDEGLVPDDITASMSTGPISTRSCLSTSTASRVTPPTSAAWTTRSPMTSARERRRSRRTPMGSGTCNRADRTGTLPTRGRSRSSRSAPYPSCDPTGDSRSPPASGPTRVPHPHCPAARTWTPGRSPAGSTTRRRSGSPARSTTATSAGADHLHHGPRRRVRGRAGQRGRRHPARRPAVGNPPPGVSRQASGFASAQASSAARASSSLIGPWSSRSSSRCL